MNKVLLLQVLLHPQQALSLSPADWDLLIRQARRANLLSRLAAALQSLLDQVPQAPRYHLEAAQLVARRQGQTTRWEVQCLRAALAPLGIEPILLKGAAYLLAELPASSGRLFGDVDILVPRAQIEAAEAALVDQGWAFSSELSDYDRRYYREWMHEIPPLLHEERGSTLDLHHTILPPTARVRINTAALFEDARPLPGSPGVRALAPATMFLHSAAHLFHEGELDNGLRDLFDLDALLRDFSQSPDFWPALIQRARVLGLSRPLFYALRYTARLLQTPIPEAVMTEVQVTSPGRLTLALMDFCYLHGLRPNHASCDQPLTPVARLLIYVRAHWLRMPLHLLAAHLARKAWMRLITASDKPLPGAANDGDTHRQNT
jgi:Uncharacterised nucleotidyltransferase